MTAAQVARLSIVSMIALPCEATAGSMRCQLRQVFELSASGDLALNRLAEAYLANDLVVDMETGVIYHSGFGNESYPLKTIVDAGSRSSSFKVIASSIPGKASDFEHATFVNTVVMQIDTWVEASEKPFVVIEGSNIGTGVCR
ncbi:hypothetical protein [Tabrizicola sp. BL-A-41-H6]|uniref:hypothetical protein n=1 Tax=Tabrizicola sp. BL-A-41-H6 TaxID=3421107 RepID=UPI003D664B78